MRNKRELPALNVEQILVWADAYKSANGKFPNQSSGSVAGTDETWGAINAALNFGLRGLSDGSSLAKLLARHRGLRNKHDLEPLTVEQILGWIDAHKAATGGYPTRDSGRVPDTDETWTGIDLSLKRSRRGLPSGFSLSTLVNQLRDRSST